MPHAPTPTWSRSRSTCPRTRTATATSSPLRPRPTSCRAATLSRFAIIGQVAARAYGSSRAVTILAMIRWHRSTCAREVRRAEDHDHGRRLHGQDQVIVGPSTGVGIDGTGSWVDFSGPSGLVDATLFEGRPVVRIKASPSPAASASSTSTSDGSARKRPGARRGSTRSGARRFDVEFLQPLRRARMVLPRFGEVPFSA